MDEIYTQQEVAYEAFLKKALCLEESITIKAGELF